MEHISELERFLQSQSSQGEQQGEGSFTLARDKALQKLAGFQLPFSGAWAVKLLQAAVASGDANAVKVSLGGRVMTFSFEGAYSWDIEEVEAAFFDPEPSKIRHVNHLVSGLWALGLGEKRAFQLHFDNQLESLVWDGERCRRVSFDDPGEGLKLTVTHSRAGTNWISSTVEAGRTNSTVSAALKEYCYTSPIPLVVDGQRFDALPHCPKYGWNSSSFPIALSFIEADLPEVRWPSGTFLPHKEFQNSELMDGAGLETITRKMMEAVEPVESSAAAAMISVYAVLSSDQASEGKGSHIWDLRHRSSKCIWIQDGAAVQDESFEIPTSPCGLVCFLSADGLANDLSGFGLADGEERARRIRVAGQALMETVESLAQISGREVRKHNQSRYSKLGNATLILGIGIGHFVTWGFGALLVTFGVFARFAERAEEKQLMKNLLVDLELFKENWKKKYGNHKRFRG